MSDTDSNVVFRFYTEKLGGTHVSLFDTRFGDMFYDPSLGELRISDGVTPGGIPVLAGGIQANYDGGTSTSVFGLGDIFFDGGSSQSVFNNTLNGGNAQGSL